MNINNLSNSTKNLSNDELLNYFLEHIKYEVQMLLNASIAISGKLSVPNGLQYMPIESYAIHLRNLISFFYPTTIRSSDVCAKDFYLDDKNWLEIRPEISEVLINAKSRADKEVGHLTTARQYGTPETKMWEVEKLTSEIIPIFKIFCENSNKINLKNLYSDIWNNYVYFKNI